MDLNNLKNKAYDAITTLESIDEELENYLKSKMRSYDLKCIPVIDKEFLYNENNYYVLIDSIVLDDTGLMIKTTDNHYYDFNSFTNTLNKIDIVKYALSNLNLN